MMSVCYYLLLAHLVNSVEQLARFIARARFKDKPYVVALAGASASGKSTLAKRLMNSLDSLHVPLVRMDGRPVAVEADMFYRDETGSISKALGGNFDHPMELDVSELESVIFSLIEGNETYVPVYDFKTSRRKGRLGPLLPDENAVIVIEGLFAIGLLENVSHLNVFVETKSRMELFTRRLVRDVARTGRDLSSIVKDVATALSMWNVYGEGQKQSADIIYRSTYSILEDKGRPSYQVKVSSEVFRERFPVTWKELSFSTPMNVEDIVIGGVEEQMRGRLFLEDIVPSRFEVSYRALIPSDLPFTRSLRLSLPSSAYTAFIILSQIMGYHPRVFHRRIHIVKRGAELIKWYPDRELVEYDTPNKEDAMKFIDKVGGGVRLHSYYKSLR